MVSENKFTEEKILWVKRPSPKHLTFAISRPNNFRFAAGQFARLGFTEGAGYIWRAYSITSAEYDDVLEFFVILIEGGVMSAYFEHIKEGDTILLDKTAQGFFMPQRFPDGRDLIMLATGSGIAPFLSILHQAEIWQRFDTLALAHSVSYHHDLIFNNYIQQLSEHPLVGEYHHQLRFTPITTRETDIHTLHYRLPEAIKNGSLVQALDLTFDTVNSRFMICGNPKMVEDTFRTLLSQGFTLHRNKVPGQIILENGF